MFRTLAKHAPYLGDSITTSSKFLKRYAGHSKWQNIKHIKGEKDAQRSEIFTKLGRYMRVAVTGD